jgi:alkylation response protein AidB-like acyl-CoA dehydrogenase
MSQDEHENTPPTAIAAAKGLNEGQRQALEEAESARDEVRETSFAAGLFLGRYEPDRLEPFPSQSEADRRAGDEMVAQVAELLSEQLDADEVDETKTIPAEIVEQLHEFGVFRMKVPREYGGLGFSQVNYNRVLMAIASHCGSTAVLVSAHQSIGVPQPLKMFGTDEQKERFLRRIADGDLSAFALTEPEVGSDPARMTTTAEPTEDGKHYVINGVKQWATNGPIAQLMVVMARTPAQDKGEQDGQKKRGRITAFVVEAERPGVETLHRCDFMGLRGIQNGLIRFDNVRVPATNIIWGEGMGLKLALRTLNTGRLTLPAACAGMGKQCLSMARRWGAKRVQWGLAVGEHEAGRQKLADIAATTLAMEAVTWLTSNWADDGRDIRIEAAMAKLFCSEAAWPPVDETLQLRGGRGYERADSLRARGEDPYPVERLMRDCRINTIIEGTSEIMRLYLAREALDPHLRRAMDLMRPGMKLGAKLKTAAALAGHYALWYPRHAVSRRLSMAGGFGRLGRHDRYVNRQSHRLATRLVGAMARHQARLERRQVLLGRLMDVGTELFAMAATCAYARHLARDRRGEGDPIFLADAFCRQARHRIGAHWRDLASSPVRRNNALAARVLKGDYEWLEEGIIPAADAPAEPAWASAPQAPSNGARTPDREVSSRAS